MRLGAIIPQGNFSANTWVKIYENELGAPATSVTISNLDGNTDVKYKIIVRAVNGYNGGANYGIRLNNDSTSDIDGFQEIVGNNATASAQRTTGSYLTIGLVGALSDKSFGEGLIYAKSGYVRTILITVAGAIATTTVTSVRLMGYSWNNTADNITSIVVLADQVSGLGTGTIIELWKPVPKV